MVLASCARCWRRFLERSYKPTDTEGDRHARRVCISAIVPVEALCIFLLVRERALSMQAIAVIVHFLNFVVIMVALYWHSAPPKKYLGLALLVTTTFICVGDWDDAANLRARSWNLMVIVIDICLVTGANKHHQLMMLVMTILWLFVDTSEAYARFGLYEAVELAPAERKVEACACASPPCAKGSAALPDLATGLLVFLLDFYFTRGFSQEVSNQLAIVNASVSVSAKVAQSLSLYDVDAAEVVLNGEERAVLPPDMVHSFEVLVSNLKQYRPFLPQSCLVDTVHGSEADAVSAESDSPAPSEASRAHSFGRCHSLGKREQRFSSFASGGATDVSSSVASEIEPVHVARSLHSDPKIKSLTLLCANRKGFAAAQDALPGAKELGEWMADDVASFNSTVQEGSGVVDLINGDHRFASFNGARPCVRHVFRATLSLFRQQQLSRSPTPFHDLTKHQTIVTGRAMCGNFGSPTLQRFMVMGQVGKKLCLLDRLAVRWDVARMADEKVYKEEHIHFRIDVRGAVLCPQIGCVTPTLVYEVTEQRGNADEEEWMYQLDKQEVTDVNAAALVWVSNMGTADNPCPFDSSRFVEVTDIGLSELK